MYGSVCLREQFRVSVEAACTSSTEVLRMTPFHSARSESMPFVIRPYRRFPVQCLVSYSSGPFSGVGMVWNLSLTGWRLSGDLPMREGEMLSLCVTLPNKQKIKVPEATVRWSRGNEFAVETSRMNPRTTVRLRRYVKRLVRESCL